MSNRNTLDPAAPASWLYPEHSQATPHGGVSTWSPLLDPSHLHLSLQPGLHLLPARICLSGTARMDPAATRDIWMPLDWDLTACEGSGDSRGFTASHTKPAHPKHHIPQDFSVNEHSLRHSKRMQLLITSRSEPWRAPRPWDGPQQPPGAGCWSQGHWHDPGHL